MTRKAEKEDGELEAEQDEEELKEAE